MLRIPRSYLGLGAEPNGQCVDDALVVARVGEDEPEEDGEEARLADPPEEELQVGRRALHLGVGVLMGENKEPFNPLFRTKMS